MDLRKNRKEAKKSTKISRKLDARIKAKLSERVYILTFYSGKIRLHVLNLVREREI